MSWTTTAPGTASRWSAPKTGGSWISNNRIEAYDQDYSTDHHRHCIIELNFLRAGSQNYERVEQGQSQHSLRSFRTGRHHAAVHTWVVYRPKLLEAAGGAL